MNLEKEYNEKISKLERTIENQRSEIEFKVSSTSENKYPQRNNFVLSIQNIEIHHKKSRKSMNDTLMNDPDTLSSTELSNMFKLHVAEIPCSSEYSIIQIFKFFLYSHRLRLFLFSITKHSRNGIHYIKELTDTKRDE